MKVCTVCKESKSIDQFYWNPKTSDNLGSQCKKCDSACRKKRAQTYKEKLVKHFGGKCSIQDCGYSKYIGALEFHHLDPNQKDFELNNRYYKTWDQILEEANKCILVCSNCHRELHKDMRNRP